MKSASVEHMAEEPYDESDPEPRGNQWILPVGLLVLIFVAGSVVLKEVNGRAFWPSTNALMRSLPKQQYWKPVGTSGSNELAPTDAAEAEPPSLIREVDAITALSDGRPLAGRTVELNVPVAWRANDVAFWVGEKGNRLLVVPIRDRRDGAERQQGLPAPNAIADNLAIGEIAAVSGMIETLPSAEEMFSWGLTTGERREVARLGVYLHVNRISVN